MKKNYFLRKYFLQYNHSLDNCPQIKTKHWNILENEKKKNSQKIYI